MSGIFLSYTRADRSLAEQIMRSLRVLGVDVWWDGDMPGVDWQAEVERQINNLAAVLVLWSKTSINSASVRDEARLGLSTDKLINAIIELPQPPFPFDRVNGLPLDGWDGHEPHRGWTRLVRTVDAAVVRASGATPGVIIAALAERERRFRDLTQATRATQKAADEAVAAEREAHEAFEAAGAALEAMREQHRRIVEMRATANVLRAAQQDLDAADAAAGVADEAHRRARADQAAASRAASAAAETLEGFFAEALRTTAVPRAIPVGAELLRPRTGGVSSQKPDAVGPGAVDDAPREPLVAVRDGESPGLDDGATPDRPEPPLQAQSAPGESPAASANPFVGRRAAIAVGVALVATAVVAGVMVSDPRTPSMSAAAESAAADSGAAQDAVSAPPPGWAPGNTPAQDAQLDADFKVCSGPALHEAVAACTRMIAAGRLMTADKLSAVRTWRGLALDKLGRRKDALSDHLVALALAPDSAAYANVGREYNDLGDYGLASQYLHQALMLDPANLGAKRELAFAHRHDRAPEAADESSAGARSTSAR